MAFGEGRVYGVVKQLLGITEGVRDRLPEIDTKLDAVKADVQHLKLTTPSAGSTEALSRDISDLKSLIERYRAEVTGLRAEAEADRHAREEALAQRVRAEAEAERQRERRAQKPAAPEPAPTPPAPPATELAVPTSALAEAALPSSAELRTLLDLAAGVAYTDISCHRDTWAFLVERAAQTEHFRLPSQVGERGDGTIATSLSGRTLIATIDALWSTQNDPAASPGTQALAARIYNRIHAALQGLETAETVTRPATRVIIDNRPPHDETTGQEETEPPAE
ncbi:hypothetical protein [Streptomyces sp. NBC_01803]|uniref:hypothetical protein n=1 Tax=Streptomyces sp. NBC_01803 TaxID=2975946 RepID=UPI002DD8E64A|nr:hypothetical protein [Streptomyces sp. NBC_01803]WSA46475.1 hypothetical protein OIE51_21200 [Streptomyces sp. NBC_01803]